MCKNISLVSLIVLLIISSCASSGDMSREEKKVLKQEQAKSDLNSVKLVLESEKYMFHAQSVQPSGGKTIQLNSTIYTLDLKDNMAKADLPFFGRGYTSHHTSDPGIKFEGEPEDYTLVENTKKNSVLVKFSVKGSNEKFDVILSISSNGTGNLSIVSQHRQGISYFGYLKEMPDDYAF